ncbi:MAG TPA: glycoside hydrolase family 2 [Bacteroides sp.]|nr:glycoside hydrolase family 2 [Bacteroides sp.]
MKRIFSVLLVMFSLCMTAMVWSQDRFAEIGTRAYQTREHLLIKPQPPDLPDINLPAIHNSEAVFQPVFPISTGEELEEERKKLRRHYELFLRDLAPEMPLFRERTCLTGFNWRVETEADVKNFAGTLAGEGDWEEVSVPHYGPPLGRAVTYYYRTFEVHRLPAEEELLYLCFRGVDYKSTVFVNATCLGFHEGFFAPFEFEISKIVHPGENTLLIKVENDYSTTGSEDDRGNKINGDKIYGATGPGYDEPELGWHHCPPAMGIYQECYLEARSDVHIHDIFVRSLPEQSQAEIWVEVNCLKPYPELVSLMLDIYGQNFQDTALREFRYIPATVYVPGVGDLAKPQDWEQRKLPFEYGVNFVKIPVTLKDFRWWEPDHPWLYQVQIRLYNRDGQLKDTRKQQFGMRSFTMDTVHIPRGNMYMNGKMIRLRGANTMGHLQQSVMRGDEDQLIDDILLAKLCNMNFLRFTQRPVQKEIYEMCDKLGMLNQTDLPLFGSVRRNQFAEAVKQAEEMERLIRSHPSAVMVTYINERFPNAEGKPHRSLAAASEYYRLFCALDQAVLLSNPDRVIKAGDGDYDPPSPGLPDNHCYNLWYNGHGLGVGEFYKGYWQPVKPDWNYGCGEFGTEGLDPLNVMTRYYPDAWLPVDEKDRYNWDPSRISMAQSRRFHYLWYNTPGSIDEWIRTSQDYQAWATKFTTETFRRDPGMVSFAIHLFIDAWPGGWMKSIMDVDRQPKKAYFAYRNALEPLMVSLRSDRRSFYGGEETAVEIWIANDRNDVEKDCRLHYQLEREGKIVFAQSVPARIPVNSSRFQGFIRYTFPEETRRIGYVIRAAILDAQGESVHQNTLDLEVFPEKQDPGCSVFVCGVGGGAAERLVEQAGLQTAPSAKQAHVLLVDAYSRYTENSRQIDRMVREGKVLLFLELPAGDYEIGPTNVRVRKTEMGDYYFVSPETGHRLVEAYKPYDFRFWHNSSRDCITPLLSHTFTAPDWEPVLSSGSSNWVSDEGATMAVAEKAYGDGVIRICEVLLPDHIATNPVAYDFLMKLLEK